MNPGVSPSGASNGTCEATLFFGGRRIRATTRARGFGHPPSTQSLRELGDKRDVLVTILGRRPFFFGDSPSVADPAVCGHLQMLCSGPVPCAEELIRARAPLTDDVRHVRAATAG